MPVPHLSISSDEALSVSTYRVGAGVVATATGEIDHATADLLRTVMDGLVDIGEDQVILDLSGVTFLGAAGLGVIADVTRRLVGSNTVLHLRSPSTIVRRSPSRASTGSSAPIRSSPYPSGSVPSTSPATTRSPSWPHRRSSGRASPVLARWCSMPPSASWPPW